MFNNSHLHLLQFFSVSSVSPWLIYLFRHRTWSSIPSSRCVGGDRFAEAVRVGRIAGRRPQVGHVRAPELVERPHRQLAQILGRHRGQRRRQEPLAVHAERRRARAPRAGPIRSGSRRGSRTPARSSARKNDAAAAPCSSCGRRACRTRRRSGAGGWGLGAEASFSDCEYTHPPLRATVRRSRATAPRPSCRNIRPAH